MDSPYTLPPTLSLANKAAIVTGGSRGIGAAIAIELASRGASICIVYTSPSSTPGAEAVAAKVNKLTKACLVQTDLGAEDCGEVIVKGALDGLAAEKIDIVVNNAGIQGRVATMEMGGRDEFCEGLSRSFNVNVRGPMLIMRELVATGKLVEKGARIVNISSVAAKLPGPATMNYTVTKSALDAVTRQWAVELGKKYLLTVNGVTVGPTDHDGNAQQEWPEWRIKAREKIYERMSADNRAGSADDCAQIVCWLCSEGARWVNGQTINGNGGLLFH